MTRDELAQVAEKATNALADIATMQDLSLIQRKARRIYAEIRQVWQGPGAEDDAPDDERSEPRRVPALPRHPPNMHEEEEYPT